MDKLDMIFSMQSALNKEIRQARNLSFSSSEWIQKETLAMLSEMAEVLDEVNFKWWKNKKEIDEKALKEELIDILHFFISMCIDAGMTADEMLEIYSRKNQENLDRQHGLSSKEGYAVSENLNISKEAKK